MAQANSFEIVNTIISVGSKHCSETGYANSSDFDRENWLDIHGVKSLRCEDRYRALILKFETKQDDAGQHSIAAAVASSETRPFRVRFLGLSNGDAQRYFVGRALAKDEDVDSAEKFTFVTLEVTSDIVRDAT